MPVISRFFGIVIYMYWREHEPPHFHAKYQGDEITVEIQTGIVEGQYGARALSLVQEWRRIHENELMENWHRSKEKRNLVRIQPLI